MDTSPIRCYDHGRRSEIQSLERIQQQQRDFGNQSMENTTFKIDEIYVPVKRRKTLDTDVVGEIAESMLEKGQTTPILVRRDGDRFVLVEGLHRLEACKALGEETVVGKIVQARLH